MPVFLLLQDRRRQSRQLDTDPPPKWSVRQAIGIDGLGMGEVGFEHGLHLTGELAINNDRRDLEIQAKRPVVEIRCTDGGQGIVDQHDFLVQEARLVGIELDLSLIHI